MSTSNQLDLGTLGSQLIMPKDLPRHWSELFSTHVLLVPILRFTLDLIPLKYMCPNYNYVFLATSTHETSPEL